MPRWVIAVMFPPIQIACAAPPQPRYEAAAGMCREVAAEQCPAGAFGRSAHCRHWARLSCLEDMGWVHAGGGRWEQRGPGAELARALEADGR